MADKTTSTRSAQDATAESNKKINDLLDQAKDAMVEAGMPPDQADAMLNAARPSGGGTVVGNYADLQRMGAIAATGTMPTPPPEDDVQTTDLNEAFVDASVDGTQDIDQDRLAFAHRLPDVTSAQEAADERHAKEATATAAGTTSTAKKADDK
jgi:hypothetical protein